MSTVRTDITLPPDLRKTTGTGPVRLQQPVFVDSIPPCNTPAPRVKISRPGWTRRRPAISKAPGGSWSGITRCQPFTAGSAITPANPPATGNTWTTRSASTRWNVTSVTWRWRTAGFREIEAAAERQKDPDRRRRAVRPVGRLAPCPAGPRRWKSAKPGRWPAA